MLSGQNQSTTHENSREIPWWYSDDKFVVDLGNIMKYGHVVSYWHQVSVSKYDNEKPFAAYIVYRMQMRLLRETIGFIRTGCNRRETITSTIIFIERVRFNKPIQCNSTDWGSHWETTSADVTSATTFKCNANTRHQSHKIKATPLLVVSVVRKDETLIYHSPIA